MKHRCPRSNGKKAFALMYNHLSTDHLLYNTQMAWGVYLFVQASQTNLLHYLSFHCTWATPAKLRCLIYHLLTTVLPVPINNDRLKTCPTNFLVNFYLGYYISHGLLCQCLRVMGGEGMQEMLARTVSSEPAIYCGCGNSVLYSHRGVGKAGFLQELSLWANNGSETFGISHASVHDRINQLVRKGYLKREEGKARELIVA